MTIDPNFILREVAGETLLISLADISETKKLLCLNEIGRDIFLLLKAGRDTDGIVNALLADYAVAEDELRADVREFLAELTRLGVLHESDGGDAP